MKKAFAESKYYLRPAALVLLAFAGGYAVSAKSGVYAAYMLVLPFAAASGFLRLNVFVKAAAFGFFGYFINSFYSGGLERSVVCAALCALCAAVCHYAAELILTKKPALAAIGAVLVIALALPHALAMGDPFAAGKAESAITDYIVETYGEETGYSTLRYDIKDGVFYKEITPPEDKTLTFEVTVRDGRIYDGYARRYELAQMASQRTLLAAAIREAFPDDRFDVYPEKAINADRTAIKPENMVFRVYIPAYIDDAAFLRRAESYTAAARKAGVDFAYIVFYGGRAGSYYRTVTLAGVSPLERAYSRYVSPVESERFFLELFGAKFD